MERIAADLSNAVFGAEDFGVVAVFGFTAEGVLLNPEEVLGFETLGVLGLGVLLKLRDGEDVEREKLEERDELERENPLASRSLTGTKSAAAIRSRERSLFFMFC